ncbi:MAG: hypothetical protein HDS59_08465 [Barnesiella sp.]|nr:hypothetical protein [Barnesiella sp.]
MKEEYVTYEQAVKLKELGFAEKVNHAYLKKISIEPELSVGDLKEVHSKDPKNYNDNRKGAGKGLFFYSAPRLDQAQKWLIDTKKLHVLPHLENVNKPDYVCIITLMRKECMRITDNGRYFSAYELALSAGIDAALELLTDKLNGK